MPKQKQISTLVGIAIIIASIIVFLGGVFAYQHFVIQKIQQTNIVQPADPTANWKTYTNTQRGFEIKYPDGGSVQPMNEMPWCRCEEISYYEFDALLSGPFNTPNDIHIIGGIDPKEITTITETTVNNLPAKVSEQHSSDYFDILYVIQDVKREEYWGINLGGQRAGKNDKDYNKKFNDQKKFLKQIVSTFKLIKKTDKVPQTQTTLISGQEAINIVKNLPDVKHWLSAFTGPENTNPKTGGKAMITSDGKTSGQYMIHAYESLPDHDVTFGWYYVDVNTGKVVDTFKQ
ncbi:MAG: hypothetical protein NTZ87_02715 [Candidatus Nomurabacteria bacterium]|nr:hypothetical protein [Candidatus Nomurabacteria bacterium]